MGKLGCLAWDQGLPSTGGSSEPITEQRHPEPCCHTASFSNSLHRKQPTSTSPPIRMS